MRIALVPSAFAPAVGGVEELTARLAHRLKASRDEVEVWTIRHPEDLPADEEINGVRVRRFLLPMPRLSARALSAFPYAAGRAQATLYAAATQFRPEVIHIQCFSAAGAYAARVAGRLRVPFVLTLQGETVMDDHDIYDRSVALRFALRRGLRDAAAVTGCSRFVLADAERRFGLAPGRAIVIANGVEMAEEARPEPLSLPFKRFVLGVGRVVEKKGFDLLLDAFAVIAPRYPDLGVVIGGDGPARDGLSAKATAAGLLERVVFPGTLTRAQVAWAMDAAAVFVLPSRIEPFGIVVLEALRAGCPTIVSTCGGAGEIVRDRVDGIAADPHDTGALAEALATILSDDSLATRLRRAGPRRAESYSWETIALRYRDLYARVTA